MKLSLWQQFSSNHSGTFFLVGQFASQSDAENAYKKLYPFLKEFSEFVVAFGDDIIYNSDYANGARYTPSEEKFYQENGIEPRLNAVEWMWTIQDDLEFGINLFDKLVIMQSSSDLANDGNPFDQLLQTWGASIFLQSERRGGGLRVSIRCLAIDENQAELIQTQLSKIYTPELPPWAWYFGGKEHEAVPELKSYMYRELYFNNFDEDDISDYVKRDGRLVLIKNIEFSFGWTRGFTAIVAWLRSQGCEVEYVFKDKP